MPPAKGAPAVPEPPPAEDETPPEPEPVPPLPDEDFEAREALFNELFAGLGAIDLKEKSRAERKDADKMDNKSLVYSEIEMRMINQLLNKIKSDHGPFFAGKGMFLDLGSGAGKACVAASLLHPFQKVVGIETIECLNTVANTTNEKYKELVIEGYEKPEIEFIQGDFVAEFEAKLEEIAPEVVLCLAVATCYGEAEIKAMATMASKMPDDSVFVTFTQGLPEELIIDLDRHPAQRRAVAVKKALAKRGTEPSSVVIESEPPVNDPFGWTPVHTEEMECMWGKAMCYVYKKVAFPDLRPPPPAEDEPAEDA